MISQRERYLDADNARNLRRVDNESWYEDWNTDTDCFDNPLDRSLAAQYTARVFVGSVDVSSFFSQFEDGTGADREYPLSRLVDVALGYVEHDGARHFLVEQHDRLRNTANVGESSLLPNVSNAALAAVADIRSNEDRISSTQASEFALELIRLREAHRDAFFNFGDTILAFEAKCSG